MVTMGEGDTRVPYPIVSKDYANLMEVFRIRSEKIRDNYVAKGTSTDLDAVTATKVLLTDAQPIALGTTDANKYYAERLSTNLDGSTGSALRLFGPSAGHIAIAAKDAAKRLGRVLLDATSIQLKGDTSVTGNMTVSGNLTVNGSMTSSSLSTTVLSTETPGGTSNYTWPANTGGAYSGIPGLTKEFVAPPSKTVVVSLSAAATAVKTVYLGTKLEHKSGTNYSTVSDYNALRTIVWGDNTTTAVPGATTFAYENLTAGSTYRLSIGCHVTAYTGTAYLYRVCMVVQPTL